jgi:hypothetical protein
MPAAHSNCCHQWLMQVQDQGHVERHQWILQCPVCFGIGRVTHGLVGRVYMYRRRECNQPGKVWFDPLQHSALQTNGCQDGYR